MGGTIKYFLKKLLSHEIFRSMISWAAKISLEICKILSPPPPAYLMYAPLLEINAIRAKSQLGTEEIRVKVKLLELHLMPAILHGLTVCGRMRMRRNSANAKQSTQTVTASPSININCKSTDGDRDMAC